MPSFTFLWCISLIFLSPFNQKGANAISGGSTVGRNRVVLAYNAATDRCEKVTDTSHPESIAAANWECEKALEALDGVKLNTCHGWREGACRKVAGHPRRQCSCTVTICNNIGIRNKQVRSFRDCSPALWTEELLTGKPPATTTRFKSARAKFNKNAVRIWLTHVQNVGSRDCSPESAVSPPVKGTSNGARTSYTSPRGPNTSQSTVTSNAPRNSQDGGSSVPRLNTYLDRGNAYGAWGSSAQSVSQWVDPWTGQYYSNGAPAPIGGNGLSTVGASNGSPEIDPMLVFESIGRYKCNTCSKRYSTPCSLKDHQKSHAIVLRCQVCTNKTFTMKRNLRKHNREYHKDIAAAEKEEADERYIREKPVVCPTCLKRYSTERGMRDHAAVHTGESRCERCGIKFARRSLLVTHTKKNHPK